MKTRKQEKDKFKLNDKQKLFCQYYVSEEFFCSWVKSYQKVYNCTYDKARASASRLLANVSILNYIDFLLGEMGLNNQRVDKELAKLILQDVDRTVKLWAMREYNKLKGRITEKLNATLEFEGEIIVKSPNG